MSTVPKKVSLEVCTACNHRCVYCPVHDDPFAQRVMSMDDFHIIANKLAMLPTLQRITLNHYNEPFMDRHIIERIQHILDNNIAHKVILYTNGSLVTEAHLHALQPYVNQLDFSINLPTVVSGERYKLLHGRDDLAKVQITIEHLLDMDFSVRINVQMNVHTTDEDLQSIQDAYQKRIRRIEAPKSSTRANLVLTQNIQHTGKVIGCKSDRHTAYLHIGVDGGVFLCPEDYYKAYAFGNLLEMDMDAVLNHPQRLEYIEMIDGKKHMPDSFICRSCAYAVVQGETNMLKHRINRFRDQLSDFRL